MKLRIEQDQDAQNPRTTFDHPGIMVCWHRRYNLGDKHDFASPEAFDEWWKENGKGGVCLPLYLYDHSGITMNTTGFSCPWDSGQVGYIYATRETILKEWGKGSRVSPQALEKAHKYLVGEVEEYDQYLTGDVWGYIVEDEQGDHLDSCWGFYGREYCEQEGQQALKRTEQSAVGMGAGI